MFKGKDTVVLIKSTNELAHTLKCIEGDKVIYYKTPDYEDYYTESEVEEVKNLEFYYTSRKSENIIRTFKDINEMIRVFNTHNKYKDKTGITNLRLKRLDSITVNFGKFDKPSTDGCIIKSSVIENYIKTNGVPTNSIGAITHASER